MNTKDKQAIMLHEQGYSTIQIAQVLNMDPSYVDTIVQEHEQGQEKEIRYHTVEDDESHKVGPKTKLTRERFEEMKRLLAQGLSVEAVATRMGFSWRYIRKLKGFKTYDDLMEYRKKDAAEKRKALAGDSEPNSRNRMTEDLWNKAMRLREKGMTCSDIAAELGFSANFIYRATRGKTYEDFLEFRKRDAAYKRKRDQARGKIEQPEQEAVDQKALEETLAKHANASDGHVYIEHHSVEDSLARIAEALEKIAEQPKKRRFFKR